MNSYTVLNHYDHSRLLGVWVSQGDQPPAVLYFDLAAQEAGELTVIGDKMRDVSWDDHMDAIAARTPQDHWWVGDIIVQDALPDIAVVAATAKAEDDRLHGR